MSDDYALFARLQLRSDATEAEVRRAYARELKKIDQETQPEAFQELREAYERLCWWLRRRQAEAAAQEPQAAATQEEAPAPAPIAAADPPPADAAAIETVTGEALGREVLNLLIDRLQNRPFDSLDEARFFLLQCMEDDRLTNIDARQFFEWAVASILASGWRPGHERLFVPAVECFGWQHDRSRLLWLGQAGHCIDTAIDELAAYDAQPVPNRAAQKRVIRALRQDARLSPSEVMQMLPLAERVLPAFPAWMHIVSRPQQVEAWRQWDAAIPAWRRRLATAGTSPVAGFSRRLVNLGLASVAVILFVSAIVTLVQDGQVPAPAPQASLHRGAVPPGQVEADTLRLRELVTQNPSVVARGASVQQQAARLATGPATASRCLLAGSLLQSQAAAHARGEFGRDMDRLVNECAGLRLGAVPPDIIRISVDRQARYFEEEADRVAREAWARAKVKVREEMARKQATSPAPSLQQESAGRDPATQP